MKLRVAHPARQPAARFLARAGAGRKLHRLTDVNGSDPGRYDLLLQYQ